MFYEIMCFIAGSIPEEYFKHTFQMITLEVAGVAFQPSASCFGFPGRLRC